MDVSNEQKIVALELMKARKVDEIFINSKGEFFTNKSYASMSVGKDESKFKGLGRKVLEAEFKALENTAEKPKTETKTKGGK